LLTAQKDAVMTDADAIQKYLSDPVRQSACFDLLYNRYSGKVYSKCITLLREEDLALDAVQDIFMKVLVKLSDFENKSSFSTWLYSVTYNHCIDFIRKNKSKTGVISLSDEFDNTKDTSEEEVEDAYLLEMNVKTLRLVFEKLPSDYKVHLLMKYQDDLSVKEMCEILKRSDSAVKTTLKRAKKKAKEIFDNLNHII
jgi:RNA polymerase sigma factor (sigma-70 family)